MGQLNNLSIESACQINDHRNNFYKKEEIDKIKQIIKCNKTGNSCLCQCLQCEWKLSHFVTYNPWKVNTSNGS